LIGHLWPQRIIGIGIRQQGQNGQKYLRNGEGRTPGAFQNVQTDDPTLVHIRVIDFGGETDLGGLEGIVGGEVDTDTEDPATKGTLGRSHNHPFPDIEVLAFGTTTTAARGILGHIG
jgi:hypothetical protein